MLLNQKREIQDVFEQILGVPLDFRDLPNIQDDKLKEQFIDTINKFEEVWERQNKLDTELGIDFTVYDDPFFRVIEGLIHFCFEPLAAEAILFYIYARKDEEGDFNVFIDPQGAKHKFETAEDLWEYMLLVVDQNLDDNEMLNL